MRELVPAVTKNQQIYFDWVVDLLIYIVIINLFAQYSAHIHIQNFTFSILIALLIKSILFIVFQLEHSVSSFFKHLKSKYGKFVNLLIGFLLLFSSKFIIIGISNIIFGDYVEFQNIFSVFILIITMIIIGKFFEAIYLKL